MGSIYVLVSASGMAGGGTVNLDIFLILVFWKVLETVFILCKILGSLHRIRYSCEGETQRFHHQLGSFGWNFRYEISDFFIDIWKCIITQHKVDTALKSLVGSSRTPLL